VVATSLDAAARRTSVRWRVFLLILLIVAVNYVDRASLSVAMPTISKEFGIDAAAQGIILSSFFGPMRSCRYGAAGSPTGIGQD
jgi:ACS family D-galactonate transporter-like MFS transporter